jgi:hypothetical protein
VRPSDRYSVLIIASLSPSPMCWSSAHVLSPSVSGVHKRLTGLVVTVKRYPVQFDILSWRVHLYKGASSHSLTVRDVIRRNGRIGVRGANWIASGIMRLDRRASISRSVGRAYWGGVRPTLAHRLAHANVTSTYAYNPLAIERAHTHAVRHTIACSD